MIESRAERAGLAVRGTMDPPIVFFETGPCTPLRPESKNGIAAESLVRRELLGEGDRIL